MQKIKQTLNLTRNADLLASFSSNPNDKKEKLLNNTLIQLNIMCHIHNGHAIKMTSSYFFEVTQYFYSFVTL